MPVIAPTLLWPVNLIAVGLICLTIRRVPWRTLTQRQLTGWLGASTLLAVLWQFAAEVRPGLAIHLLGASALCLIARRDKALIGTAIAVLANCANGRMSWSLAGWTWLLALVPAVWIADRALLWSRKRLPANYFIYFFVNGFFGAALSYCIGTACLLTGYLMAGHYPFDVLVDEALPYYLLFAWAEAFTTGLVLAPLVMYRPEWVESFDDSFYLRDK
ncbi:MAG: energy-coupling factor ABC transporter permease [Burkholderiales bacterium]|nr:energy-coupling factor ABC transporter permease [Burkholderiales bacterium]